MPRLEQPSPHPYLRLRGARLLDGIDEAAIDGRKRRKGELPQPPLLPAVEPLIEERHDLVGGDVAGDGDEGVVGPIPILAEAAQVVDGDRFHGLRGASRRLAPRMLLPVEELRRLVGGQEARVSLLLREARELQLADPIHVSGAERRVLQDVGEELDGSGQRFLESVQPHPARLVAGAGSQFDGVLVQLGGELSGGARPGAFGHHAGDESREPRLAPRLAVHAGREEDVDGDDRHRVQLADQHAGTVAQLALDRHRRIEAQLPRQRGRLLGPERRVGRLLHGVERRSRLGGGGSGGGRRRARARRRARVRGPALSRGSGLGLIVRASHQGSQEERGGAGHRHR